MLNIFSCVSWPSVFLLWRNACLDLLPIFLIGLFLLLLLLSCMNCLSILKIKLLSVASFVNVFSHSIDCLFVLFMVSFALQKLLSLIRSHLFLFLFPLLYETNPKWYFCNFCYLGRIMKMTFGFFLLSITKCEKIRMKCQI